MPIDLLGLNVDGVSVGGFASTLDIPEWKVAVDLGVCVESIVAREHVLISHGHADHLGAIAQHVAQRGLRRMRPGTYLVPPGIEGDIEELLGVWRSLDGGALLATIRPIAPGDRYELRRDLAVRPFRTRHRVVSQGWLFESVRRRLKDELHGLEPADLAARRARGEDLDECEYEVELAVTSDTTFDAVLADPEILNAKRLIVEATFLDDDVPPDVARKKGHVHLDEIAAAAREGRLGCEALLINHVSPRYGEDRAQELLRAKLPPDLLERTQLMYGFTTGS